MKQIRVLTCGLALLCAVGLTACGSSSSSSSSSTAESTTAAKESNEGGGETDSVLGSPNPAKGEPIDLGMINLEGSPAGSYPQLREAAEAAVDWVNEYGGGIHGQPIKLDTCVTNGDPSTSASCANKLVEEGVVAVAGGADFGTSATMPIFEKANLAWLGGTPFSEPEMTSPNSIQFYGFAAGVFPALAAFTVQGLNAETVSVIYPDIPAGKHTVDAYTLPILEALGVEGTDTVPASPETSDYSSIVAAATQGDPDVVLGLNTGNACTAIMQSLQNLGSGAELVVPGVCAAPDVIDAAGPAAEGVYLNDDFDAPGSKGHDVELYEASLEEYAEPGTALDEFSQAGFSEIVNIWKAFNEIPAGKLETAAILKQFRTGSERPNFMAHPYTCDGKLVPHAPAICNASQRMLKIEGGAPVQINNQWYSGTQYLK